MLPEPSPWADPMPQTLLLDASPLPACFYTRPTAEVARDLLGKLLVLDGMAGMIVETEAYLGQNDGASHAAPGPTARNAVMFGLPGISYVYFIYGMHHCLNAVAHPGGHAGAVLLRAIEPMCGLERMRAGRPKAKCPAELANGPGKLTSAFGVTLQQNGLSLAESQLRILLHPCPPALEVAVSPRIGIRKCADWPLRYFVRDHRCVSPSRWNIPRPGEDPAAMRR